MRPQTLRNRIHRLLAFEQAIDMNLLMSVTDRDGHILSANKKFCEVCQYSEPELIGKNHSILNSGYHQKSFFSSVWDLILEGNTWKGQMKNKSKDGSYYWIDTAIVPILDDTKKPSEFLSLSMLISNSKEAEFTLTDAAFTISHKIRQPFVNMQALLTIILMEDLPVAEIKNMARIMQSELDKIDSLTRQMALDMHEYKVRSALHNS